MRNWCDSSVSVADSNSSSPAASGGVAGAAHTGAVAALVAVAPPRAARTESRWPTSAATGA